MVNFSFLCCIVLAMNDLVHIAKTNVPLLLLSTAAGNLILITNDARETKFSRTSFVFQKILPYHQDNMSV